MILIAVMMALSALVAWGVAAWVRNRAEALRLVPALQPHIVLLDNHLPGVKGVDAIPGLREVAPAARVLMLTGAMLTSAGCATTTPSASAPFAPRIGTWAAGNCLPRNRS